MLIGGTSETSKLVSEKYRVGTQDEIGLEV